METAFYTPPYTQSLPQAVYAIGNFDGLHRGHQSLFAHVRERACTLGLPWGVITFEPHPRAVLSGYHRRLTPFAEKMELLKCFGVQHVALIPFNAAFAQTSAGEFVEKVLQGFCQAHTICVGEAFRFGPNRSGDLTTLTTICASHQIAVKAVPLLMDPSGEEPVSSRRLVAALHAANTPLAAQMLGRPYTLTDEVIEGDRRGRKLGFPTANLRAEHFVLPQRGVYQVTVSLEGALYKGVANIGVRPTFRIEEDLLEVHLLDFDGDIYGQRLEVRMGAYMRPERKFAHAEALIRQIREDCKAAQGAELLL